MKRKYIDVKLIRSWEPCYDPCKIVPEDWKGTVMDILTTDKISNADKVWLVCHKETMTQNQLVEFARNCIVYAADAAAHVATYAAAAAATAAVDVAYATTDVTYAAAIAATVAAADAAARVAERQRQVDFLIKMFGEV